MPDEQPTLSDHLHGWVGLRFSGVQPPVRPVSEEGGEKLEEKGEYRWPLIFC